MSKPTPKQNFIQTLLIMATVWLGMTLFLAPQREAQQQQAALSLTQVHDQIVDANRFAKDQSIVKLEGAYESKLEDAVKAKQFTRQQADEQKLWAGVMVGDTQYYQGLRHQDSNQIRVAYLTLHKLKSQYQTNPAWENLNVQVWAKPQYGAPWTTVTPSALHEKVLTDLSSRNQTELVYGIFPGYKIIDSLVSMTGRNPSFSFAFAAFLLAFIVRAIVFPLSQKQLMFSRQMSQLVPLTNEIKAKYKDDPTEQQRKVMELYKEYGINPLAGCGPAVLQLPLFLTVYQFMLKYAFGFQAGYFLWINPVTSRALGWTAPNLGEQDAILIVIYGITMLSSTLLAPVSDPTQVRQQKMMGIGISVMWTVFMFFWTVPSGFVLYWTFTNLLSTIQSLRAYRMPLPPLQKVNAAGGGVYPKAGMGGRWMRMMEEIQKQAEDQKRLTGKDSTPGSSNGQPTNGKPTNGKPGSNQIITGDFKTGTPAKHKPKKRK